MGHVQPRRPGAQTGTLVSFDRAIVAAEVEERFLPASGPGGQNVNKVASAVQLRFSVVNSAAFDDDQRARLMRVLRSRLTLAGEIVLLAQSHRTQSANREDARERLFSMLERALERQRPRIKTKPSRAAKERRLSAKTQRGQIKRGRGRVTPDS
ncbi:aminoacyl-tRNA hydrolase [bacterium]|nr:aminoacyl-tRNA hydrolase [bacterium]